jgi:signal transduction histidine kinase
MSPEERARFLNVLDASSTRLEQLVRRMLDLARAEAMAPGGGPTDPGAIVVQAVDQARRHGLDVVFTSQPGVPVVAVPPEILQEIVGNLLDNARLHGGDGVHVELTLERDGAGVRLRVRDNGAGISAANAERIFRPFFTTARERGGTGLGLSIVRALVEAHAGTLVLEAGGPGVSFVVRLPASPRPPGPLRLPSDPLRPLPG